MNGKFAIVPREMPEDERLKALDIIVYVALDTFVNSAGEAWPSLPVIAERAKVSSATVKRSIQRLQSAGYIVKRQRRRPGKKEFDSTLYELPFRRGEDNSVRTEVRPDGAGVGSLKCAGSALPVQEVGSERDGNDTHRTIPNERECADADAENSAIRSRQHASLLQPSDLQDDTKKNEETAKVKKLFDELWERYPRKEYKGQAKKAFMALFSMEIPPEKRNRRLKAIDDQFLLFEEQSEEKIARGEGRYIPCLHNWLEREGFADADV